jgi:uncharacterized membrane protein
MTKYESDIKTISSPEEMVFAILSDLNNLSKLKDNPQMQEKLKDMEFNTDSCSFGVEGFGRVGFRITDRIPLNTIKFVSEHAPVTVYGTVELNKINDDSTGMKLAIEADLPMMIKMMMEKKMVEGINMIADILAKALSKDNN